MKARQRQCGEDANVDLPVFYSTNTRQRKSDVGKQHGRSDMKQAPMLKASSINRGLGRRNGSGDDSSDSDSDRSSDEEKYHGDVLPRCNKKNVSGRRDRSSSKENESSDEEHFKKENLADQNGRQMSDSDVDVEFEGTLEFLSEFDVPSELLTIDPLDWIGLSRV